MSRMLKTALALGVFLAALGATLAGEDKKPVTITDKVEMKATVVAVDRANRILTLKGDKGATATYHVDEAVERFDKVKVGDKITVKFYESVAFDLRKPGDVIPEESRAGVAGTIPGSKPAGAAAAQATTTVTVEAVDMDTPSITVKTKDGTVLTRRVKNKNNLKDVQVGDTIVITKTEALVVELT